MTTTYDLSSTQIQTLLENSGAAPATGTAASGKIFAFDSASNNHEALFAAGTAIFDAKLGTSTIDPAKTIGTYSFVAGTGTTPGSITYNYTGGGSYSFYISPNDTTVALSTKPANYNFCLTSTPNTQQNLVNVRVGSN